MKKQLIITGTIITLLAAPASYAGVLKGGLGSLLGAGAGAWLGSNVGKGKGNIAAIATGTLLGAAFGNGIGSSLDRADNTRNYYAERYETTYTHPQRRRHAPQQAQYNNVRWASPVTYTQPQPYYMQPQTVGYAPAATTVNTISSVSTMNAQPAAGNAYCREYIQTITVGNKTKEAYGKACFQPDGSWKIIE